MSSAFHMDDALDATFQPQDCANVEFSQRIVIDLSSESSSSGHTPPGSPTPSNSNHLEKPTISYFKDSEDPKTWAQEGVAENGTDGYVEMDSSSRELSSNDQQSPRKKPHIGSFHNIQDVPADLDSASSSAPTITEGPDADSGFFNSSSTFRTSDSSIVSGEFNPIPPPLPFDHNDCSDQLHQPEHIVARTSASPGSLGELKKRVRSRPAPLSASGQGRDGGNERLAIASDESSAHKTSAETPSGAILDQTSATSPTTQSNSSQLLSCSTQLTGAGRYTGSFNQAGQFHGYGTFEWIGDSAWSGDVYKGMWADGEKCGHGIYTSADGSIYDGLWLHNKKNGHGCTFYNSDGRSLLSNFTWCQGDVFDGEFVNNVRHGACEYTWFNGEKLRCVWDNGRCHEWSKKNSDILSMFMVSASHLELIGRSDLLPNLRKACCDDGALVFFKTSEQLLNIGFDSKTATGLLDCIPKLQIVHFELPGGGAYKGETFRGVFHGKGVMTYKEGDIYDGEWRYGQRDGFGIMHYNYPGSDSFGNTWSSGDKYQGEFRRDIRHGSCEYTWCSGQSITCSWNNGSCAEWIEMNSKIIAAQTAAASLSDNSNQLFPESVLKSRSQGSDVPQSPIGYSQHDIVAHRHNTCSSNTDSRLQSFVHPSLFPVPSPNPDLYSESRSRESRTDGMRGNEVISHTFTQSTAGISPKHTLRVSENAVPLTYNEMAEALGISRSYVGFLKKSGMPMHSIEAAKEWRMMRSVSNECRTNQSILHTDCIDSTSADHDSHSTSRLSGISSNSKPQEQSFPLAPQSRQSDFPVESGARKKFVVLKDGTTYEGECNIQGQFHGKGKLTFVCGDTYVGEFLNNSKNGKGTYVYANQSLYNGYWKNGKKHGKGVSVYKGSGSTEKYVWSAGDIFDGEFAENVRHGPCEYTWSNGTKLRCVWNNGDCPEWSRLNDEIIASSCRSKSPEQRVTPAVSVVDVNSSSESSESPPPAPRPAGIYNRSPAPPSKRSPAPTVAAAGQDSKSRGLDKYGWHQRCWICNEGGKLLCCEYNLPEGLEARAVCPVRQSSCAIFVHLEITQLQRVYHTKCAGLLRVPKSAFICAAHSSEKAPNVKFESTNPSSSTNLQIPTNTSSVVANEVPGKEFSSPGVSNVAGVIGDADLNLLSDSLGVSIGHVSDLIKGGMPVTSVAAAKNWCMKQLLSTGLVEHPETAAPWLNSDLNKTLTGPISKINEKTSRNEMTASGSYSQVEDSCNKSPKHVSILMESESQQLEYQQSVVLKHSIQYFATHLGFTESEVLEHVKAGMPIDRLEAAQTWLQLHGQTNKVLLWHGSNYIGERNHLNQPHGSGRYVYACGSSYEGSWCNGKKNGFGKAVYLQKGSTPEYKYEWSVGDVYYGGFCQDVRNGPCEYTWFNGEKLRCVWDMGKCPEWFKKDAEIKCNLQPKVSSGECSALAVDHRDDQASSAVGPGDFHKQVSLTLDGGDMDFVSDGGESGSIYSTNALGCASRRVADVGVNGCGVCHDDDTSFQTAIPQEHHSQNLEGISPAVAVAAAAAALASSSAARHSSAAVCTESPPTTPSSVAAACNPFAAAFASMPPCTDWPHDA